MWCNGVNDAISWLKRGVVPPCMAWESAALLLRGGQTIVFSEQDRGAWTCSAWGKASCRTPTSNVVQAIYTIQKACENGGDQSLRAHIVAC